MCRSKVHEGKHLAKSSMEIVPIMGASRCVWGSMPPGMTYLPSALITRVAASPCIHRNTRALLPASTLTLYQTGLSPYLHGGADRFYAAVPD